MDTMEILPLVWRMNLFTPCKDEETMTRFTSLIASNITRTEKHFNKKQSHKIINDMMVVAKWHEGFYRKDNKTPYVVHPFEILELVFSLGIYDYALSRTILYHDTVEDEEQKDKRYRKRQFLLKKVSPLVALSVSFITKPKQHYDIDVFFSSLMNVKNLYAGLIAGIAKLVDYCKNSETFDVFDRSGRERKISEFDKYYLLLSASLKERVNKMPFPRAKKEFYKKAVDLIVDKIRSNIARYT
jgi:(p)ppGpp synthase/HD superfamily hydrolase